MSERQSEYRDVQVCPRSQASHSKLVLGRAGGVTGAQSVKKYLSAELHIRGGKPVMERREKTRTSIWVELCWKPRITGGGREG